MVSCNPVEPGGELGVKSKPADTLEGQEKYLLSGLSRFIRVAQHSQRQIVDGALPLQNEPVKRHHIAALACGNPGCFLRTLGVLRWERSRMRQGRIQNSFHPCEKGIPRVTTVALNTPFRRGSMQIVERFSIGKLQET